MQTRKISKDLTILFHGRVYRDKYGVLTPGNIGQEVLVQPWDELSLTPGITLHSLQHQGHFMGALYVDLPPNRAIVCEHCECGFDPKGNETICTFCEDFNED